MGITLEEVEILKAGSKLNYREAVKILEEAGGDLLEAIALLEERGVLFNPESKEKPFWHRLWNKGKSIKVKVNGPKGTMFRIPLLLGLIAVAAFPRMAVWGGIGLILTRCFLEIESK